VKKKHVKEQSVSKAKIGDEFLDVDYDSAVSGNPLKGKPYRCYESHGELLMGKGVVVGASCLNPRKGYDIYVGLDYGMSRAPVFPWSPPSKEVEVYFPITDRSVPKKQMVGQFKLMVDWLAAELEKGKSVHIGCIGGHGRTGLLLAALRRVIHGDSDAGSWVRAKHCKEAIETDEQVQFLKREFGIKPVPVHKEYSYTAGANSYGSESYRTPSQPTPYIPMSGMSMFNEAIVTWRKSK
jgi:hypothetical protein